MRFKNGLFVGRKWVFGNGGVSTTNAVIASYHRPDSITWRWVIYWNKWKFHSWKFFQLRHTNVGYWNAWIAIPFVGTFSISTQPHMIRKPATLSGTAAQGKGRGV